MAWLPHDYSPLNLIDEPTHTVPEMRREYSRMRDIAMKRAYRLERKGLTAQAEYLRDMFPTLKEMQKKIDDVIAWNSFVDKRSRKRVPTLADYISKGHSLLEDLSYSLEGIKQLQTHIEEATGVIVRFEDTLEFKDYMASWRMSAFSRLVIPSDVAVELYNGEYKDVGGSFSNFYTLFMSSR